ncbi:AAA family ATPase [Actinobacillus porcinus]|uniref:AAA family ATPase n=1 Tax=Actinobacillus porcinus TaxID=51048 RepID=UPI002A91C9B5|nr:AAA family ATPase [Actinobacillus porcinus]MDY6216507.1 AAA family ATPase [Actinobacillus porcinus]
MSKVSSLSVEGFKSIRELKNFELNNLNVLIGANGAGKSNFINLFRLLNEIYEQRLQLYVQKQGGPDAILHFGRKTTESIKIHFEFARNGYAFELAPTNDNRIVFENERIIFHGDVWESNRLLNAGHYEACLKDDRQPVSNYVRAGIKSWKVYHFHDTSDSAKVKQIHSLNDNLSLKSDAANLAAYLRMLKDSYEKEYNRIVATIRLVLPFFDDFVHRENIENIELEWVQKGKSDTPLKAHMLSDGSLRFICLSTLLLQPIHLLPDTVLIDEPELGLHPYAITVLADILKQVSERKQIIVSTQSVELVNELEPEDVIVVNQKNDESIFERLDNSALSSWLEEYTLGELWKNNVFGGRP